MINWVEAGENGGLSNMVVFLHKVKKGKAWQEHSGNYDIDQKNCDFDPWIQVVPKGSGLTVKNSDPVLHNIHIRELKGVRAGKRYRPVKKTMFNEGQPPGSGDIETEIKSRIKDNFIRINCEAHNFMFAWIFAADHPYVVQTGKDGSYTIDDIPAGKYKLRAWHPTLGLQEEKLKSPREVRRRRILPSKQNKLFRSGRSRRKREFAPPYLLILRDAPSYESLINEVKILLN